MKNLNLKFIGLFACVAMLFTACDPDVIEPGGGDDVPPSIRLVDDAGFIAFESDVELGQPLKFKVEIDAGSSELNTLTIFEDGSKVPLNRLNGMNASGDNIAGNAILLVGANKAGSTWEIEILPDASITAEATYTYAFEVADDAGDIETASVIVNTIIPFTALEMSLTGVLFNQAGPAGKGGLDLDEGIGTGSNDDTAEIQDEGIDNGSSTIAGNWRQQISAANDAVVVFVEDLGKALGNESLTFADIEYQEQVADAFTTGTELDGDDANCDCTDATNGEKVSQPLKVDDIFAIKRGDRTYLIQCTAVNVTEADNNDSYEFSIKY